MQTNIEQEIQPKSIPLSVTKQPYLKIIGLIGFILMIVLVNVFFLKKDGKPASVETVAETFSSKSLNPVTQDDKNSVAPSINANQEQLKQKLEEAKAKDFVERLQAVQSIDSGSAVTNQATSANVTTATVNGQSATSGVPADSNSAFLQSASNEQPERSYAGKFAPQPYLIGQGKFIFGTLAVAINSDLPGQVSAIVNQDVYGEAGRNILIPRGSRLIGEYRSGLANNQSRLFVVWTRVIQPNGISIMIGSEGTDALGQAGLTGNVDYHFFARFGASTLISLIGAGASTVGVNPDDQYNSMAAYRQAVSQSMAQQSSSMLNQSANIPPTIRVKQGEKIVVFVNKDLDFTRVYR